MSARSKLAYVVAAAALAGALLSGGPARAVAPELPAAPQMRVPQLEPLVRLAQRRSEEIEGSKIPSGPSSEPGGLPGARPSMETRSPASRAAAPKPKKEKEKKKDSEPPK
jgi:hypothetical protein